MSAYLRFYADKYEVKTCGLGGYTLRTAPILVINTASGYIPSHADIPCRDFKGWGCQYCFQGTGTCLYCCLSGNPRTYFWQEE